MLHSFFQDQKTATKKMLFLLLLLLTLVSAFSIQYFDSFIKSSVAPSGIVSFELAKELPRANLILKDWEAKGVLVVAALSLGVDFLFILAYASFIALLLFLVSYKNTNWIYKIGKFLITAVLIAGFLDVIENIALINLLIGEKSQFYASLAFYMAFAKFSILGLSILFIIITFLLNFLKKFFE